MEKRIFLTTLFIVFVLMVLIQSCATTKRNLVYFSNLEDSSIYSQVMTNQIEPKITSGDALSIKVTTLNPQSNVLYNSGSVPLANSSNLNNANSSGLLTGVSGTASLKEGYIVDKDGCIIFPLLGKIQLGGLTLQQAQQKMVDLISKTDKGTIVNIAIQNFRITVIGEVTRPGSFTVDNDNINLLEALGMAGDLTPYAVRSNILVIREREGLRTIEKLNINDKDIFKSPYFYLQQNDVIYVQPENKLKSAQVDTRYIRVIPILTAAISALAIVLSRVL